MFGKTRTHKKKYAVKGSAKAESKNGEAEVRHYNVITVGNVQIFLYDDDGRLGFSVHRLNMNAELRRTVYQSNVASLIGALVAVCQDWSNDTARIPNKAKRNVWRTWAAYLKTVPVAVQEDLEQAIADKPVNGPSSSTASNE